MLENRFGDPFYRGIAVREMGLSLFSEEEILGVTFFSDIKEGDYLLQYRRPLRSGHASADSGYTSKGLKELSPLLSENNLTSPFIGVLPSRANVGEAFRIIKVLAVNYRNEFKAELGLESVYTTPRDWSFRQTLGSVVRDWSDAGYVWSGRSVMTVTLSNRNTSRFRSHFGLIGKFDTKQLQNYLRGKTKTKDFYSLFWALTSHNSTSPSVANLMSKLMDEGCTP